MQTLKGIEKITFGSPDDKFDSQKRGMIMLGDIMYDLSYDSDSFG